MGYCYYGHEDEEIVTLELRYGIINICDRLLLSYARSHGLELHTRKVRLKPVLFSLFFVIL